MSHDLRCEHSTSPPKRCRCDCEGRLHGVARVRAQLGMEERPKETSNDQ